MIERVDKKVNPKDVVCISSNYFDEKCKSETDKAIEEGLWVCFAANCIGHTRAIIFENAGEGYLADTYGEYWIEAVKGAHTTYFRLK